MTNSLFHFSAFEATSRGHSKQDDEVISEYQLQGFLSCAECFASDRIVPSAIEISGFQ